MTLQEYLKEAKPVFSSIVEILSLMLEKHAMNHAPDEEELRRMQAAMDEVKQNLSKIQSEVKRQIEDCTGRYEKACEESREKIDRRAQLYDKADALSRKQAEQEVRLAEAERVALEYENLSEQARQECERLEQRKNDLKREAEEQNEKLKKWWWVPGYGQYLAFDKLFNDLESSERCARDNYDREKEKYEERKKQACREQENAALLKDQKDMVDHQCAGLNEEIKKINGEIDDWKRQLVYWEDMQQQVTILEVKLSAGKASPDVIMEALDMIDMFMEGAAA